MGDEDESNDNIGHSYGSFWRSVRRASQFADPVPKLRRIILGRDEEEEISEEHRHVPNEQEHGTGHNEFLPVLETEGQSSATETTPLLENGKGHDVDNTRAEDEFAPLRSKLDCKPRDRVQEMQRKRDETRAQLKDDEREPLLITTVRRDDGTEAEVIIGQSTLGQTIFNSSNVLIGVGLLALPLAFRYAGWVFGLIMLLASSLVTKYTAGLLAKCADVDSSVANFGDIAFVAFGEKGRITTSLLITIEMLLTCVGLVILFADTIHSLGGGQSLALWKIVCGLILAPLNFVPLRWLGYTSFLGIFCSLGIILVGIVMGFVKQTSPGSLVDVATTYAFPPNWRAFPLSWGLILALWTGHSVFPNIYRDMRHPPKYSSGLKWTFGFVTSVDILMAVVGYLLYGEGTLDELTTNIIKTDGYSNAVKILVLVLILIVPLTKFPLQVAPIISTLEVFSGIDSRAKLLNPNRINKSKILTRILYVFFRLLTTFVVVVLALVIPSFELIAGVLGGLFGYLICITIPLGYHLKMFHGQIGTRQMVVDWMLIVVSAILGIVGTVWEFLPRDWMGL